MRRETHSLHRAGIKTALLGMAVNLVLAVTKITAGVVGNSYALVADGIESTADILSSLVVLGGLHVSARPADAEHPFGHGKAEPIAGVVVASMLFAAAVWIAWSSLREIGHPHHTPAGYTLLVLALVVVIKAALSRWALRVGNKIESSAVRGDAWHHRSDAITSAAAFIGIAIALWGGPGFEQADDWAALAACGVMVYNSARLVREGIDDLMDRSISEERLVEIRRLAGGVPGVVAIEKCRARRTGLALSMDIHVTVDGGASVRRGHEIGHAVKDRLLASSLRITDVTVHVEPDDLL